MSQKDEIVKYTMSLAIIDYIGSTSNHYFHTFNDSFNDILICLKLSKKIAVDELFAQKSKYLFLRKKICIITIYIIIFILFYIEQKNRKFVKMCYMDFSS